MLICDEINVVAVEIKLHNICSNLYPQFPMNYYGHIGDYYYVMATVEYGCVDFRRFYSPYDEPKYVMRATRNGVSICLDKWAHLLELMPTIHERYPSSVRRIVQQGKQ